MEASSIQPPSNSIRSALGIRDFKLYWIGQTVSMLGDQLHNIAVVWLILLVTAVRYSGAGPGSRMDCTFS